MISSIELFDDAYLHDSSSIESSLIDLRNLSEEASLFFEISLTGLGSVNAKYMLGLTEDDTFITPINATNLCSAFDGTSGTSGRDYFAISSPILAPFMKVHIDELDGTDVTISANLIVRGNTDQ